MHVLCCTVQQTRQLHDGGSKHKFNVDEFNKKKRADKLHGAHSGNWVSVCLVVVVFDRTMMLLVAECMHNNVFPTVHSLPSLLSYIAEREVQQQLAEIERAAKEALATDRVQNSRSVSSPTLLSPINHQSHYYTPIR